MFKMATWGATFGESIETLPGDELVEVARYRATHAISIDAPPEVVWAWLVQIGQGRGGMYSYDWLENLVGLDMHSADAIVPELQTLAVGDLVRLVPEGTEPDLAFVVDRLEAPHLLVLGPEGSHAEALASGLPYPAWTFLIRPAEVGSRLVVRFRCDFRPTVRGYATNKWALEPIHLLMERKMLRGIKERAERQTAG